MKRVLLLLLCAFVVLPLCLTVPIAADADDPFADPAPRITTDKTVYTPGEEIRISAAYTGEKCWIGIVPADKDGNPILSYGTIWWKYIPEQGFDNVSLTRDAHALSGTYANELANIMGVTTQQMLALPTGNYFIAHIGNNNSIAQAYAKDPNSVTFVPITITQFTMEKTSFLYGESIPVRALYKNDTGGYLALSRVDDDGTVRHTLRYTYVTEQNLNTDIDLAQGILYGRDAETYGRLPAGRYVVYFVDDNKYCEEGRDVRTEIYIDIVGVTLEKTNFAYGEPILVKGYGDSTDWIGIGQIGADGTPTNYIRWRYITHRDTGGDAIGLGSGVAFDLLASRPNSQFADIQDIPPGEYVVYIGLDNCGADAVSLYNCIPITVSGLAPSKPRDAVYALTNAYTGLAGGTLTVMYDDRDMESDSKPTALEIYWADESLNPLPGYSHIGTYAITGTITEITIPDAVTIPYTATHLMVRARNGAGNSAPFAIKLPKTDTSRNKGNLLASFQVVSDTHIGESAQSNAHTAQMLADILQKSPESIGVFIVGDLTDHGYEGEYQELVRIWSAAQGQGLKTPLYLGHGNHDALPLTVQYANTFLSATEQTTTPYYYIHRSGQHFIFLSSEISGVHAYLSDAQLAWLSNTLETVAADGAPVFIFLHQPLYNTVAGTLADEEREAYQGWNGVIAGDQNLLAWQELTAQNGKDTNDRSLMKGQFEAPLREILAAYPSAILFSGHSHWQMQSAANLHAPTDTQPNYLLNTASVSYLWTDDNTISGGYNPGEGSQGYYVTVYENCIEICARDFLNRSWIAGANYTIWLNCEHQGLVPCDPICKWCSEPIPDAQACAGEHACSNVCKYCQKPISAAEHSYYNPCDADCNACGAKRTPSEHEYNGDSDANCNLCGAMRDVTASPEQSTSSKQESPESTTPSDRDDQAESPQLTPKRRFGTYILLGAIVGCVIAAPIIYLILKKK